MPTSYTLPRPATVPASAYSVEYTLLADGRTVMTYAADEGTLHRAYFTILDEDLNGSTSTSSWIANIAAGSKVKTVATPDGGFAVIFDEDPPSVFNSQSVHRFSATGHLLQQDFVLGAVDDYEITVDRNGDLIAAGVLRSGNTDFLYTREIPLFGPSLTEGSVIENLAANSIKASAPIRLNDGRVFVPIVIETPWPDGDEVWLADPNSTSRLSGVQLPTNANPSVDSNVSVEARVLGDGNVLVVYIPEAAPMEVHVYDPTLTTVLSSQQVGAVRTNPVLRLVEQADGTFVALVLSGFSTVEVVDISANGMNAASRGLFDSGINTSSQNLELNGLDAFNLVDGGFGTIASLGSAPTEDEIVTIFDQGTNFTEIEQMSAPGRFDAKAGADFVRGTPGEDTIIGGRGGDALWGNGGDDRIFLDGQPNHPDFIIFNDQSFDVGWGGAGDDRIRNQTGNSEMFGGDGKDTLLGGTQDDHAEGGAGDDLMKLGQGNDTGLGGGGSDVIILGAGNDLAKGGVLHDFISGGSGEDELRGQLGKDHLRGGHGSDTLFGGAGNDTLLGGSGDDFFEGGNGRDVFVFNGDGHVTSQVDQEVDVIDDFASGTDRIRIRNATDVTGFSDLEIVDLGTQTVIEYGNCQIVLSTDVTASDFQFV